MNESQPQQKTQPKPASNSHQEQQMPQTVPPIGNEKTEPQSQLQSQLTKLEEKDDLKQTSKELEQEKPKIIEQIQHSVDKIIHPSQHNDHQDDQQVLSSKVVEEKTPVKKSQQEQPEIHKPNIVEQIENVVEKAIHNIIPTVLYNVVLIHCVFLNHV